MARGLPRPHGQRRGHTGHGTQDSGGTRQAGGRQAARWGGPDWRRFNVRRGPLPPRPLRGPPEPWGPRTQVPLGSPDRGFCLNPAGLAVFPLTRLACVTHGTAGRSSV